MPSIDDLTRAEALPAAPLSTSDLLAAAREARAAALRAWFAEAWRKLAARSGPTDVDWTAWRGE
jgi:predicted carbohydrate-binding protein with CBM5 and CBM33 domain